MQAMLIDRFGGPEVFRAGEIRDAQAGPGGVLLRVAGSSVNPIDCKLRSGAVPDLAPEFPAVLHGDVSGEVLSVGAGVSDIRVGDRVIGCAGGVRGLGGALASRMSCDAALLAPAPTSMDLADAAGLPLVAITAWEALDQATALDGQRVLVIGGAGGVGHVLLQLARVRGAVVDVVCSAAKADLVRELGADQVFAYDRDEPVPAGGYTYVFDTVGGRGLAAAMDAVAEGGQVITIQARGEHDLGPLHAKAAGLRAVLMLRPLLSGSGRAVHGAILASVSELVDRGRLELLIDDRRFSMAEVGEAHARLESGRHTGKVILHGW